MAEPPTVSGFQFREDPVASKVDLADRLGEPIWVPAEWPVRHNPPELLVMLPPHFESGDSANDFRVAGRLLHRHSDASMPRTFCVPGSR